MSNLAASHETRIDNLNEVVSRDAEILVNRLQAHQLQSFPPQARKTMRALSSAEVSHYLGINDGYLRKFVNDLSEKDGADIGTKNGARRSYTLEEMQLLRETLHHKSPSKLYLPWRRAGEHLSVIAVTNFKGGSSKTTTTTHLAQYLAFRGYRTLVIDLDPQASLTSIFGIQPELNVPDNDTVYAAIRYDDQRRDISEIIRETYIPGLHIIPANLELMEFETETPQALMSRKPGDSLFFARLAEALASVEDAYDVVVCDCPPNLGYLTLSALLAANGVLITIHPEMLDVASMGQFLLMLGNTLDVLRNAGAEKKYDWLRYGVTRFEPNDGPQMQMDGFLRSLFGPRVLQNAVLKSTAVSDASMTKQTLYEVERSQFTRSTFDRAMDSINSFNAEVEALIRNAWRRT